MGAIRPGSLNDGILRNDPYDLDKGWKPTGYFWALEGVKGGPVSEWGNAPNIDGVYQTALILKGDTFSCRDYVFINTGEQLAATVKVATSVTLYSRTMDNMHYLLCIS